MVLSVDIRGKTTTPNLFKDIDGVRSARIGAYQTMYAYYCDFYSYAEVLGIIFMLEIKLHLR